VTMKRQVLFRQEAINGTAGDRGREYQPMALESDMLIGWLWGGIGILIAAAIRLVFAVLGEM
jgi:hypothetical protein